MKVGDRIRCREDLESFYKAHPNYNRHNLIPGAVYRVASVNDCGGLTLMEVEKPEDRIVYYYSPDLFVEGKMKIKLI
jgi:hypothetical protein